MLLNYNHGTHALKLQQTNLNVISVVFDAYNLELWLIQHMNCEQFVHIIYMCLC